MRGVGFRVQDLQEGWGFKGLLDEVGDGFHGLGTPLAFAHLLTLNTDLPYPAPKSISKPYTINSGVVGHRNTVWCSLG